MEGGEENENDENENENEDEDEDEDEDGDRRGGTKGTGIRRKSNQCLD